MKNKQITSEQILKLQKRFAELIKLVESGSIPFIEAEEGLKKISTPIKINMLIDCHIHDHPSLDPDEWYARFKGKTA